MRTGVVLLILCALSIRPAIQIPPIFTLPPIFLTETCKTIQASNRYAASGVYMLSSSSQFIAYEAYCEMGLGGGGFTFLSPEALTLLTNAEVQSTFTDKTQFLLRVRTCNGNQLYSVLKQLPQYSSINLFVGLNDYTNYQGPQNLSPIGLPFLFFGFLPMANASNTNVQGFQSNGSAVSFSNCDKNPNSYFVLYPNFQEKTPNDYSFTVDWPLFDTFITSLSNNPSTRLMPPEYFMFLETHMGGCGWYTQTDSRLIPKCILGATIGFR